MVGDSRIPDVAKARRIIIFEEAYVGSLASFICVDSESREVSARAKVTSLLLFDVVLLILLDHTT